MTGHTGKCAVLLRLEMHTKIQSQNLNGRHHLEGPCQHNMKMVQEKCGTDQPFKD